MLQFDARPVLCAVVVAAFTLACGTDDRQAQDPDGLGTPIGSSAGGSASSNIEQSWPLPGVEITREQAIALAYLSCTGSAPEVTAAREPHNPVARLMTRGEYEMRLGGSSFRGPSEPVWIVQFEGESYSAGLATMTGVEPSLYRYVGCDIDARTGEVQGGFRRASEPLLLPQQVLRNVPGEVPDPNYGVFLPPRDTPWFTREQLIALLRERFGAWYFHPERAEIELVAYTEAAGLQLDPEAVHPVTPTPVPRSGYPAVAISENHGQPVLVDRLAWLAIVPVEFGYDRCLGGPISFDPQATRSICFYAASWTVIDAHSGETLLLGSGLGAPSPQVTSDESGALQRLAWAEGWWEMWHQVKEYAGERLPVGLAGVLDRPDAPTPTPRVPATQ